MRLPGIPARSWGGVSAFAHSQTASCETAAERTSFPSRGRIARVAGVAQEDLEAAVRSAWALDTCDPADADDWSAANPSRGQCGSTALVIHDLLGGDLLIAEVLRTDGSRQGVHYWNLLPDGTELDLTRDQFADDEVLREPSILQRPAALPNRCAEQYLTMRYRVFDALGITDRAAALATTAGSITVGDHEADQRAHHLASVLRGWTMPPVFGPSPHE